MELCREGIEVSHRSDAVPQSPPRWDKTSLARSCEVGEVAGKKGRTTDW